MVSLNILRRSCYRNWVSRPTFQRKASPSSSAVDPWVMMKERSFIEGTVEEGGGSEVGLYKFYSIAHEQETRVTMSDGIVVGSSHGWLAFYRSHWPRPLDSPLRRLDMFLENPLHNTSINLPAVETLPFPSNSYYSSSTLISSLKFFKPRKVITSCSPKDFECRAIMSFGPRDWLAYCCPKLCKYKWTPIVACGHKPMSSYDDFVYSRRRKQLFCLTKFGRNFESWNLDDPLYPRLMINRNIMTMDDDYAMIKESLEVGKYLVFAERSNRLFLVRRNVVMEKIANDDDNISYKTVGFDVYELFIDDDDPTEKGEVKSYMNGNLGGMAFFIGCSGHGFVIEKDEMVRNVEPDSIYYTNPNEDICIFNYKKKEFSTCDVVIQRVESAEPPLWFTPSLVG
ncbi:hypothetical protein ABFS83_08G081700 [Erythranthe nasuta]